VNPHTERIPVTGEYYHNYLMQIMHECSTVTEVIEWANKHQRFPYMHDQMHFADKTGDAVIISAGNDGEMVFTRKTPGDGFLVSTNFNVANPANAYTYPAGGMIKPMRCWVSLLTGRVAEFQRYYLCYGCCTSGKCKLDNWNPGCNLVNGVIYLYYFTSMIIL